MLVSAILTWAGGDIATWSGTLLTGVGMVITWLQAGKAKKSVDSIQQVRDDIYAQIADRNAHSELSGLAGVLGSALRAMDKYGPGSGPTARRGYVPEADAGEVRKLTVEITRLRGMLTLKFGNDISDVPVRINDLLSAFAAAQDEAEKVQRGCDIYLEINEFNANVKQALDSTIVPIEGRRTLIV